MSIHIDESMGAILTQTTHKLHEPITMSEHVVLGSLNPCSKGLVTYIWFQNKL